MKRILLTLGLIVSVCGLFAGESKESGYLSRAWNFTKSASASVAANTCHIAAPVAVAYCTHHLAPVIGKLAGRYVPRACSNSWVGMCAKTALIFGSSYASAKLANKSEEYFANKRFFAQYAKPVNLFTFAALASSRKARYALGACGLALTAYAFIFNRGIQYFYRGGDDSSLSTEPKVEPQAPLRLSGLAQMATDDEHWPGVSSERQHELLEHVARKEGIDDGAQIKRLVEQFCSDEELQQCLRRKHIARSDYMVKKIMREFVRREREELQRSAVRVQWLRGIKFCWTKTQESFLALCQFASAMHNFRLAGIFG